MQEKISIHGYYPNYFSDAATARVALRITEGLKSERVQTDIMGLCSDRSIDKYKGRTAPVAAAGSSGQGSLPTYRDAISPGIPWAMLRRVLSVKTIKSIAERRFLSGLKKGDIVYLWPEPSLGLYREAKARGCVVVSERINTLVGNSARILDAEFKALGIPATHGLTEEMAEEEVECLGFADFIFSPSPAVTESIIAAGISESKILRTSYGLDSSEVLDIPERASAGKIITALFAGSICMRKGVHLLLSAWEKADVDARLVLVGRVSPEMEAALSSACRANPNIEYREHTEGLGDFYRNADFFILPSLEEGSPLVSYEALGASLPLVASPMGAGEIVEDRKEGLVIDPHDQEAFAAAIRSMVEDGESRARMAAAAKAKASRYTWNLVASRRREILLRAIADQASGK
jgi:glycosyltransferase involved in cell wall biosynthesis